MPDKTGSFGISLKVPYEQQNFELRGGAIGPDQIFGLCNLVIIIPDDAGKVCNHIFFHRFLLFGD